MPNHGGAGRDPIDFASLAAALLDRAEVLVPQWLPGGKRQGHEWVCGSLTGEAGSSCSVNLVTGHWADFAGDDKGTDLISLYAAIEGLNNGQAARKLMAELGWSKTAIGSAPRDTTDTRPDPPPADALGAAQHAPRKSLWRAIVPVPPSAPAPTFEHWERKREDIERTWEYRFEGQLYGHVVRFRTSDGGKEILPYTWCVDESDGRGTRRWHWKQWDEPRPLYVPATLLSADVSLPVVLVEGEKCALAGHELLGHEFDFVSWPGGGKAWAKAAWGWLKGRAVFLWPDCDSKRSPLSAQERKDGVDPASKPLKPEARQPGMQAMVAIGSLLLAMQGCTVSMCPIPKPGAVADGWDLADAIAQGWDAAKVRDFIRSAHAFVPPDEALRAKTSAGISTPSIAGAGNGELSNAWRGLLLLGASGAIKAVRENLVLALDGRPNDGVPGIAAVRGLIGFNEFSNEVMKLGATPWGTPAGVWDEADELLMGDWLTREHWLPSMARATLEEAVLMVAKRHSYHPVRQQFVALRGRWDGQPRLATWLRRVCLEEDEFDDAKPEIRYLGAVGTWLLVAMVARVMQPGCKFDYMVILEGPQGCGKSTLAALLGGEYSADTGLILGDKDSYQNLQGVRMYEMGELDAMSKAEITKVKLFISSRKDRFRASFDRRPKDYPRQVVFIGTTNEDHYLTDPTGNRRFWPVRITRTAGGGHQIDLEWVRDNLPQMLAEAVNRFDAGERFHPTQAEQRELFQPQQAARVVDNAIASKIASYLHPEGNQTGPNSDGLLVEQTTLVDLLGKIGIGVEKLGPGRFHERQAAAALRSLGWTEVRSRAAGRPRLWRRPGVYWAKASEDDSTSRDAGSQPASADDDCPF